MTDQPTEANMEQVIGSAVIGSDEPRAALDKAVRVDGQTMERLKAVAGDLPIAGIVREAIEKFLKEYGESDFDRMCRALNLCEECKQLMARYCESSHRSLESIVRNEIWKYWGEWNHGEGCPR